MLRGTIERVLSGRDLSETEARQAFDDIMEGRCSEIQMAAFLTGLRMKGESRSEILAAARAMRARSVRVEPCLPMSGRLLDTCGTGGDGVKTFNISTTVALLLSAHPDLHVAKHGNVSNSSLSGSADLVRALGVNLEASPEHIARSIEQAHLGFIFAASHHPAMRFAAPVRKGLGIRTIFNVLGPLTNPADAPYQLMGVFDAQMLETLASVLLEMGSRSLVLTTGLDGMDEVSICSDTQIVHATPAGIRSWVFNPENHGFAKVSPDDIRGDTPEVNREISLGILRGQISGPRRDIVVLNAGFALLAADVVEDVDDGFAIARELLDSGAAAESLERFLSFNCSGEEAR